MSQDQLDRLVQCLITAHVDDHINCESCGEQFECLAEQAAQGADISVILPAVEKHLACCSDCREEFEALVAILRAEDNGLITS
ncbi:MAG: hypothetical protein K8L99_14605 [Anaerolineae bacterium]|nr:hypothetical protein [Anaerolineae bacterium]